jgi:ubiquinone/menaquinone biosynthesis C-methylase UbiE
VPDLHAGFQTGEDSASQEMFRFLDGVDSSPTFQEGKRRMIELLAIDRGQRVLDVGCGLGHEVLRLAARVGAEGAVVGVDHNPRMIAEAKRRAQGMTAPITFQVGDALHLDFPDHSFDRARCERVLLYLERPEQAIAEMARVVRPGGRIGVFDLDYGGTLIDGPDRRLTERVMAVLTDSVPSGWVGRKALGYFLRAGLVDVSVTPYPMRVPYPAYVRLVEGVLAGGVEQGQITAAEVALWSEAMSAAEREGRFLAVVMALIVVGRKA